jgi:hypothetical protein
MRLGAAKTSMTTSWACWGPYTAPFGQTGSASANASRKTARWCAGSDATRSRRATSPSSLETDLRPLRRGERERLLGRGSRSGSPSRRRLPGRSPPPSVALTWRSLAGTEATLSARLLSASRPERSRGYRTRSRARLSARMARRPSGSLRNARTRLPEFVRKPDRLASARQYFFARTYVLARRATGSGHWPGRARPLPLERCGA